MDRALDTVDHGLQTGALFALGIERPADTRRLSLLRMAPSGSVCPSFRSNSSNGADDGLTQTSIVGPGGLVGQPLRAASSPGHASSSRTGEA